MSNLSDSIYDIIKERLAFMEEGTCISARNYANDLNVSYTTVRETLLRLSNEGYMKRVPRVGFFKANTNYNGYVDYWQTRAMIESYVIPRIIEMINDEDISSLKEIVNMQVQSLENKEIMEYSRLDIKFHCYLIDKLGNKMISNYYINIREQNQTYSKQIIQQGSSKLLEEHKEFIFQIENKNYKEAMNAILRQANGSIPRMTEGNIRL